MNKFARLVLYVALVASAAAGEKPPGLFYISPVPGAKLVRAETNIIVRWNGWENDEGPVPSTVVSVRGESSGEHTGDVVVSEDRQTVLFSPHSTFHAGEEVSITLRGPRGASYGYSFTVSPGPQPRPPEMDLDPCLSLLPPVRTGSSPLPAAHENFAASANAPRNALSAEMALSLPSDFPPLTAYQSGETAEGKLFFSNWGGTPYLVIMENDGTPVFYRRMVTFARDFKVHPNGLLSYFLGGEVLTFFVMDSTYTVIDSVRCGNGYETDEHELLILPNGHYLIIGKDYQTVDMSKIVVGGSINATVVGNIVQELDRDHNVVFEWRSWDHFAITDCEHVAMTARTIDYVHMNAIDVDEDGNLLLSSRNMSEVTKIDRTTGEIIWRFGGKNSMFSFANDPLGFSYQHDIRSLGNGRYTLYDNGNYHDPPESRPVEYLLDTTARTATLVWDFRHDPIRFSWWMGNAQRLSNGNTLIGWGDGTLPVLTEVRPDGSVAYELAFTHYAHCYRAFRFPWSGRATSPYLLAETRNDTVRLFMNTFGDSSVVQYRVFGGTVPGALDLLDSSSSAIHDLLGFEAGVRYYLRVAAVDSEGRQGSLSNEVSVQLRSLLPGDDMVLNGTFEFGLDEWVFEQNEGAIARAWVNEFGECRVDVSIGGPQTWSIQLRQEGFELRNGRDYEFTFRARALSARSIEVKVEEDRLGGKNYSGTGTIALKTTWRDFSFNFTMMEPTDLNARIVFNCGKSNAEVLLDDVTLREVIASDVAASDQVPPGSFALRGAYPNPFNPSTALSFDLPEAAQVRMTIYTMLGQVAAELLDERREAGRHTVRFDGQGLASGLYVCRMTATATRSGDHHSFVTKLMLLK